MSGLEQLLKDGPIDITDQKYRNLLEDIQGNILTDHGRDYVALLCLTFKVNQNDVKKWITGFAPSVTSAWKQYEDAKTRKRIRDASPDRDNLNVVIPGADDIPFYSFFLSSKGYEYLQLTGQRPDGKSFRNGMKNSGTALNDPPSTQWESSYKDREIHAMILAANDDPKQVDKDSILNTPVFLGLENIAQVYVEIGHMMYLGGERTKPLEHFGYIDGLSNPLFLTSDPVSSQDNWKPWASLNLALVPEIPSNSGAGSFLVFRKLEQNVKRFQILKHDLALKLNYRGEPIDSKRIAGAYAVGRFTDGTPVTMYDGYANQPINDFNYGPFTGTGSYPRDEGQRCPLHAHIRRANPRENNGERNHRIVRRGITYSNKDKDYQPPDDVTEPTGLPENGVGLLFMCYQSDIENQFEYLQKKMNLSNSGIDPITGQVKPGQTLSDQLWPKKWNAASAGEVGFPFGDCISLKGGEYFFAPSISFLKSV